jgi:non-canonical purine NTP pyrophosphatase (RdgB/HAM1 family)
MKKIYFVTGNKGKVMAFQNRLPEGYIVEQLIVDLPELQNPDVEEIVREKAKFAYEKTGKSVIVQDSAFHIDALSGFPGPYIKYINETIGAAGVIKLMEGEKNRKAYFRGALGYVDEMGNVTTFTSEVHDGGYVANEIASVDSEKAWSEIWKIYVPKWGGGKTLSELSMEEIDLHEKGEDKTSEFFKFVEWLKNNQ